jgi:hypothetical protein
MTTGRSRVAADWRTEPDASQIVALISRTALAAVAFPKTGGKAHRLSVAIAFSI